MVLCTPASDPVGSRPSAPRIAARSSTAKAERRSSGSSIPPVVRLTGML